MTRAFFLVQDHVRSGPSEVKFTRISRLRRNLLFLFVILPRGLVAVVLADTGRGAGWGDPGVGLGEKPPKR